MHAARTAAATMIIRHVVIIAIPAAILVTIAVVIQLHSLLNSQYFYYVYFFLSHYAFFRFPILCVIVGDYCCPSPIAENKTWIDPYWMYSQQKSETIQEFM